MASKLGFTQSFHGNPTNSQILLMWKSNFSLSNPVITTQSITMDVIIQNSFNGKITCVYAKCNRLERKDLWEHLTVLSSSMTDPWFVGGDLNAILDAREKKGGRPTEVRNLFDFQNCILQTGLIDAGFSGNPFTWSNNRAGLARVWKRLDRIMVNADFQLVFPKLMVAHLERVCSDHAPLCVKFEDMVQSRRSIFTYQRMWADHPTFHTVVATAWSTAASGSPGQKFHRKLMHLQRTLKDWNWSVFGDLRTNIKLSQERVQSLEYSLQTRWDEDTADQCATAKAQLLQYESWEAEFLCQKARIEWSKDGDRNTKLYHATIKDRRRKHQIQLQKEVLYFER